MLALLSLAWPIVISRSTQVVVSLTDAVMVGHLGEAALASTTTGSMNAMNLMILPMGIVFIVSTFSSQHHGAGDPISARRYAVYGLVVAALTEAVVLLALPLVRPVLGLLPLATDVRELMGVFLLWRLPSAGAVVGMEALAGYYGGKGNTRLPMVANLSAMGLNVIGCVLLVPRLGVKGSAIANLLASSVAFLGLLAVFARGGGVGQLRSSELWKMLRFGVPSGLNWFLEFAAFSLFINTIVAELGTTALAAMMAVLEINTVAFMPAFGVASAGAILVGQAIGEKARERVQQILRRALIVNCSWQGLVGLAYVFLPMWLLKPFSGSAAFIEIGARLLLMAAAWQIFDAAVNTYAETLRAAGDTTFTLWARVGIAWIFFFPGVWLHKHFFGISERGAIAWVVVYIALLAVVLRWRFRSGAWKRIELVSPA